ncbi:MAG: hypothetical protein K0S74_1772 [Chlamydiales bacterium]|jgi:molecular chaperone DnaK (HSP70)|nr:hypothetical protein [Chlamydiales bacterium]
MTKTQYIVGIDLGTTNSTVSYIRQSSDENTSPSEFPVIERFPISQLTSSDGEAEQFSLPSFLYIPLKEENQNGKLPYCIGEYARERGAEVPHRVISSAKSWLCHQGIDHRQPLFPLLLEEVEQKISIVTTLSAFLTHIKATWDKAHPENSLKEQTVLITVPASFDPNARQYIQECAEQAGYPKDTILIEEPLAAFYAWLSNQKEGWRQKLKIDDSVLVIDIGGGTTDFTLIKAVDEGGRLSLQRVAVGTHLLLGGDNLDLALAYFVKHKLEGEGKAIDDWQMQRLIYACRQAKEALLGDNPPQEIDINIAGRGRKLVGGGIKTTLTKEEVDQLVLEGFTPLISAADQARTEKRSGLQQIGLPYAQDPRITSQLAKFLSMTGEKDSNLIDQFIVPTAVLFNGGTMKAAALRKRLIQQLNDWAATLGRPIVKELQEVDLDFAVSQGAAYYGFVRKNKEIRVKAGTAKSYYIGVADAMPAIPGLPFPLKAICVVPYGMEEGSEEILESRSFHLLLGEPVQFRFFSHATPTLSNGEVAKVGTIISDWKNELTELSPIESEMEKESSDPSSTAVKLKSQVTELGVLELHFIAEGGRSWKLEFNLRQ